jgi:hypothetical protein
MSRKPGKPREVPTLDVESEDEITREVAPRVAADGSIDTEEAESLGALNAETVRYNRIAQEAVRQKKSGARRVPWGESNAARLYDNVLQIHHPSGLHIQVDRLSGSPASWFLTGQPRSGKELYEAIKRECHGIQAEADYKIAFIDATSRLARGIGRLTIPSTLQENAVPQPGMTPASAYYGYTPGAFHVPPQGQPPPPPGWSPHAPPPPPADLATALGLQRQLSDLGAALNAMIAKQQGAPAPPIAQAAPPGPVAPPPAGSTFFVPGYGWCTTAPQGQAQQAPPQSATSSLKQSLGQVRELVEMTDQARGLLPQPTAGATIAAADEGPTKLIDLGKFKIMQNLEDGSMRPVETMIANAPEILGWIEGQSKVWMEHAEKQRAHEQRIIDASNRQAVAAQQPAQQQQTQQQAPPPPAAPPVRRTMGAPSMPGTSR